MLNSNIVREKLKPTESMYDSMHCYFSGGTASVEIDLAIQTIEALDKRLIQHALDFCNQNWTYNCGKKKIEFTISDGKFKGMASTTLAFIPVFNQFLQEVLSASDTLMPAIRSFKALAAVVVQLQRVKNKYPVNDAWLACTVAANV